MSVVTGLRAKAETESRVNFILAGEDEDTGVRLLSDGRNVRAKKKNNRDCKLGFPIPDFSGPEGFISRFGKSENTFSKVFYS